MDKKEYKIRLEEIMSLIAKEEFEEAAERADLIDWREIKSFGTLEKISNLYKVNRRYDHAFEIAELAYSYNPVNSNIVYSLCELSIELNNLVQALEYLTRYRDLVPNNPAGLILEYKIKELGKASLEEKIDILEEYKHKDPKQEWMYQLAYLYHRVGLATKCVETCDELITMIGDGPFVIKAMELKMLHTPLSKRQQAIYDARNDIQEEIEAVESDEYTSEKPEPGAMPEIGDEDFHVKTIDMGKFNTINLQKALADSMKELLGEDEKEANPNTSTTRKLMKVMQDTDTDPFLSTDRILGSNYEVEELADEPEEYSSNEDGYDGEYADEYSEDYNEGYNEDYNEDYNGEYSDDYSDGEYSEDYDGNAESYEEGYDDSYDDNYADNNENNYDENYDNAEGLEDYPSDEYVAEEGYSDSDNYSGNYQGEYADNDLNYENNSDYNNEYYGSQDNYNGEYVGDSNYDMADEEDVFFDDKTGDIVIDQVPLGMVEDIIPESVNGNNGNKNARKMTEAEAIEMVAAALNRATGNTGKIKIQDISTGNTGKIKTVNGNTGKISTSSNSKPVIRTVPRSEVEKMNNVNNKLAEKKEESYYSAYGRKGPFDDVLSQEIDGQISLAIPKENSGFEKQITGQMNIQEVLSGWEEIKKEREKKQQESINNKILESTGKIFENYDHEVKNGILAKLEEEEKQTKRLINNDLELHKVDDFKAENLIDNGEEVEEIEEIAEEPFSATAELNKVHRSPLFEEVDRAIELDKAIAEGLAISTAATGVGVALASEGAAAVAEAGVAGAALASEGAAAVMEGAADLALAAEASEEKANNKTNNNEAVDLEEILAESKKESEEDADSNINELEDSDSDDSSDDNNLENSSEDNLENNLENIEDADNTEEYADNEDSDENGEYYDDNYPIYDENGVAYYYDGAGYCNDDGEYYDASLDGYYDENGEYMEFVDDDGDYEEYFETVESLSDEDAAEEFIEESIEENLDEEAGDESGNDIEAEDADENSEETDEENINDDANNEDFEEDNADNGEAGLDTAQINDIGSVLEANADKVTKAVVDEINDEYDPEEERDFSIEEQELFANFMYSKKMRNQILKAVDLVNLASYVGNVIITGDEANMNIELAKALIKEVQLIDANFISQKVAKISGNKMNTKDIAGLFAQLSNGALIVEKAGEMRRDTLENITKALENPQDGILIILLDTKKAIEKIINKYPVIEGYFNARVDVVPMSDHALVEYAKKYAYSKEYKIDEEKAILALHQRIDERQIGDHYVTTGEIEEIIDAAIEKSGKPRVSTLINIVTGKRYDHEDMIILREKDFT